MTESYLLTLLLEKPHSYVENPSIEKIGAFLNGYRNAVRIEPDPIFRNFGKWLRNKFRITQDRNWLPIIRFFGQGEDDTLNLAKNLWVKYLKEVSKNGRKHSENKIKLSPLGKNKPSKVMDHIFAQPAMYLGHKSVSIMHSYINGFIFGKRIDNLGNEDPLYYNFQNWIVGRFEFGHSYSWDSIISFIGRGEENSFQLAKDLWQEYVKEQQEKDLKII